ncbi:unnamed protein product [Cladocopium goreaui]|uniref:Sphingomyelinase phosphodiesterase D (ASM-lik e phosphodiesterase D) n=1 Tax=Cladocopium goreaui TaxID=2562237 RepID=A0A9P1DCQ9_9DINO|nr:unnamed protein product [Cladocopium goreaui]
MVPRSRPLFAPGPFFLSFWPSPFPLVPADFVATLQVACDAKLERLQRFAAFSWEPELFTQPDASTGSEHMDHMAIVFSWPLAEALGRHAWEHKPEFLAALRCLHAFELLSNEFAEEDQLKRAVKAETKVYIAGHIPPVLSSYSSTDLWQKKFVVMYWHLMSTYREVIAGQFFSHIHRDEFRVVDLKDSSPPLMLFASVSPVRDNNPAFYKLQLRKGQLSKIQGFWADLSKETPEFTSEYSAPPSLVESLSNLAYRDLAFSFADGSDEGEEKWQKFFAQSAVQRLGTTLCDNVTKFDAVSCSECIGQCRERAVCTLLYGISASSKQYCVEDQLWKKHQELKATEELMTVAEVLLFSVALLIFLGLCYLQYRRCKARRRRIGEDLSLAGQVELGPVDESNESNESNAAA